MNTLTLKDTIPFMLSEDFKERLIAEYLQAKIRYGKLNDAITKADFNTDLLEEQAAIMKDYLTILEARLKELKVDIEDI